MVRLVMVSVVLCAAASCTTARGLVDDGDLERGCSIVERAPSPLFDDDAPALASRIRHKLPGTLRARAIPHEELEQIAGTTVFQRPRFIEVTAFGDGIMSLRSVTLIDEAGTRLRPQQVDNELFLSLTGAPVPPAPRVHTSTHTPGPFEAIVRMIGMATVGLPLSIATFGAIPADFGGLFNPTATTTSTWTEESPKLAEWRARPDVQGAARLAVFAGAARGTCAAGTCRTIVPVNRHDVWREVELSLVLGAGGCAIDDVVRIPFEQGVELKDTPHDDGHWGRFWKQGLGFRYVIDDIGDACEGCSSCCF